MKIVNRKTIAAMVAGTFIIAGAATPFIVQAAEAQETPSAYHQKETKKQLDPQVASKRISDTFGIEQSVVLKYNNNGMSFKDIGKAAFLAKAGNKSIDSVISKKTADNNWKDVAESLGITKEQIKTAHQDLASDQLNKRTGIDKKAALNLLQDGYHPHDIGMASQLATASKKPIKNVLALKKINNTWSDVAAQLGIDAETFKKDFKNAEHGSHHKGPQDNDNDNDNDERRF
jgi:hypothetical protein